MTKDSTPATPASKTAAPTTPANPFLDPLFAVTRALIEEISRETQRWTDHSAAHTADNGKVLQAMREQLRAATEQALDLSQRMAGESYELVVACMKPLTRGVA